MDTVGPNEHNARCHAVYLLREPGDGGAVRYVGRSRDPRKRAQLHVSNARRKATDPRYRTTGLFDWLNALSSAGQRPALEIVGWYSASDVSDVERATIREHGAAGSLLNVYGLAEHVEQHCSRCDTAGHNARTCRTRRAA